MGRGQHFLSLILPSAVSPYLYGSDMTEKHFIHPAKRDEEKGLGDMPEKQEPGQDLSMGT